MRKVILFCPLFLTLNIGFSQDINKCKKEVDNVYRDIISSIGNSMPSPPSLEIISSEKKVAYLSKKAIFIEEKAISIFCGNENFKSEIAFILSHEIAHHYLNHTWMQNSGLAFRTTIDDFIDDKKDNNVQRKLAETQADLFGGFFSLIAGYESLKLGKNVLQGIYDNYQIPEEINGYPSLNERFDIIDANLKKAETLTNLFNIGNLFLVTGNYNYAKKCFEEIISSNFNTWEIYNNLGVSYLFFAIENLPSPFSNYIYPIFIEQNTRADLEKTRSGNFSTDPKELLEIAIENFSLSLQKDQENIKVKMNKVVAELLINYVNGQNSDYLVKTIENLNTEECEKKYDLYVTYHLLDDNIKKAKKMAKNGSAISRSNMERMIDSKIDQNLKMNQLPTYDKINLDEIKLFGLSKPYSINKVDGGSVLIKTKEDINYNIHEIDRGKKYVIEIFDPDYLNLLSEFIDKSNRKVDKKTLVGNHFYEAFDDGEITLKKDNENRLLSILIIPK